MVNKRLIEHFDDCSGNVRILSPTIFRRIVNEYSNYHVRIEKGDTYGINTPSQIIGVNVVAYAKESEKESNACLSN